MIYYDLKSKKNIINSHYKLLKDEILDDEINKSSLNIEMKNFIKNNLKEIIISEPKDLNRINRKFKSLISNTQSRRLNKKVAKIFDYKKFSAKSVNNYDAYDLAKKLSVRTCLYCNRVYTLTVKKGAKRNEKITRPQFDHFFDKDKNPLLALSIFNLIPSCNICNSTLKGSNKFNLKANHHPYVDNFINDYNYTFKPYDIGTILGYKSNLEVGINISNPDVDVTKKIDNSIEIFKLKEIMSAHSDELMDLFNIRYRFSERYFKELFETYHHLGLSIDDIYKVVFGVEYNEKDFNKRPFSKIKKDLLIELNIL